MTFYRFWQPRERRVLSLNRPSSRGGGEAEDPVGGEPWTRPGGCHGDGWAEAASRGWLPRGAVPGSSPTGREWPELAPGAAFSWQTEPQ